MAEYNCNCRKCTNICVNEKGEEWCRTVVEEGKSPLYIASGTCGKDFVFDCDCYSTDPDRTILKVW